MGKSIYTASDSVGSSGASPAEAPTDARRWQFIRDHYWDGINIKRTIAKGCRCGMCYEIELEVNDKLYCGETIDEVVDAALKDETA